MTLSLPLHSDALVSTLVPVSALPLELRLLDAESAHEAAEAVWVMRGRDLDARPCEETLRLARWAAEDFRDARERLESLRLEVGA